MSTLPRHRQLFNQHRQPQSNPEPPNSARAIAATNIQPGEGDVIATCDAKVGSVLVRGVAVRRGLAHNNYVEFPPAVELISPALGEAVCGAILAAVAEAVQ